MRSLVPDEEVRLGVKRCRATVCCCCDLELGKPQVWEIGVDRALYRGNVNSKQESLEKPPDDEVAGKSQA